MDAGNSFSAVDLSDWAAGHTGSGVDETSLGEVIDRQALAAYRTRLAEIDAELDEVRQRGDAARIERLEHERDALLDQLRLTTGLGARTIGGTSEGARVAVCKAVAAAIERIAEIDSSLGRLLRECVRTGARCV
ncbi:MAG TPA: hypothetical protein VE441_15500 [Mycobacterium sp.]|jgi:hypothetical protein|nr:hypothetical protein [Mycobacterium sp.]